MRNLRDISDLKDKKVLMRADFDVPVSERGEIEESFRIKKQKETLDYLVGHGAKVVIVAHLHAKKDSFAGLMPQLHLLLGSEVGFIKEVEKIHEYLDTYPGPGLLENTKSFNGEEENDKEFGRKLADEFDIYVNNAFAACHRNYASISTIADALPSYAGFLIEEEVAQLEKVISAPPEGKVIIIGGAKASTKVPVIKHLIGKSEAVLLGGVVANDVLKEKGQDMGSSVVDEDVHLLLMNLELNDPKLHIPEDFIVYDNKILDIGDHTMKKYIDIISSAKLVVWNGPMGLFENPTFAKGTNEVAQAIIASSAFKVAGGGDTIFALDKIELLEKFDFISTGGGAMLAFLAGDTLPGLAALD